MQTVDAQITKALSVENMATESLASIPGRWPTVRS